MDQYSIREGKVKKQMINTEKLIAQGYRCISRKFGLISRIDRADWREHMAQKHSPWDPKGDGMRWVGCLELQPGSAEDQYRRCYSKDTLEISPSASFKIPCSDHDPVGFIDFKP